MTTQEAIDKYNDEAWNYECAWLDDGLIVVYDWNDEYVGGFTLEEFIEWNHWKPINP